MMVLPAAAVAKPEYVFGFYFPGAPTSLQGQMKSMSENIASIITGREKFAISFRYYRDEGSFLRDIGNGEVDFIYTSSKRIFVGLVNKGGYKPLFAMVFLGVPWERYCFFTDEASAIAGLKDLKNKKIIMSVYEEDYYVCRKAIGDDLMKFFYNIKPAVDILSAFYALKMYDYDAVFISDQSIENLKITNPGPVRGVKQIACSEEYRFNPFLVSKTTPAEVADRFKAIMMNTRKDEDFKTYWPLFKTFKFRFTDVSLADYVATFKLFENAERQGWKKDFDRMEKIVENASE